MKFNDDGSYRNNGYETSVKIVFWCGIALIVTVVLMLIFN
jgi:hypothetical protein